MNGSFYNRTSWLLKSCWLVSLLLASFILFGCLDTEIIKKNSDVNLAQNINTNLSNDVNEQLDDIDTNPKVLLFNFEGSQLLKAANRDFVLRCSGNCPTVSKTVARDGTQSLKTFIDRINSPVSYRTEITSPHLPGSLDVNKGSKTEEYWFGFSLYVPGPYPVLKKPTFEIFFQIHSSPPNGDWTNYGGFNPPMALSLRPSSDNAGKIQLVVRYDTVPFDPARDPKLRKTNFSKEIADYQTGRWIDIVIHTRFTPDSSGFTKVWIDHKLMADVKGGTYYQGHGPAYAKYGLYMGWKDRSIDEPVKTRTLYHDSYRFVSKSNGGNYESVVPRSTGPINQGCAAGKYLSNGSCVDVGKGYFSPVNNDKRTACASGMYSDIINAASCKTCTNKPANASSVTYTSATGTQSNNCAYATITCSSGYTKSGNTCIKESTACAAGKYLSNGSCIDVGKGYFSPANNDKRTACASGMYSDIVNAASCKTCTNKPANASSVTYTAATGTQSNNCAYATITCISGYTKSGNTCIKESTACAAGKYLSNGSCIDVGKGYFSPANNDKRTACASGMYSDIINAASCKSCTNKPANASSVTYTSATGTQSNNCAYATITCSSGYIKSGNTCIKESTACAAGKYLSNGSCIDVGKGYFSPANNDKRTACASGMYSDIVNAASCKACTNRPANASSVTYTSATGTQSNNCAYATITCLSGYTKSGNTCIESGASELLFSDSFETGKLEKWGCSGNCPSVSTEHAREGRYSMKSYVNAYTSETNYRTEAVIKNSTELFQFDQEYWMGFSYYLPSNWSTKFNSWLDGGVIFQWHDKGWLEDPSVPVTGLPIAFYISGNKYRLSGTTGEFCTDFRCMEETLWSGPEGSVSSDIGKWTDWVVNVKFTSKNDGFYRIWKNGKQIVNNVGPNHDPYHQHHPYFKMGLYFYGYKEINHQPENIGVTERTIYHDAVRIYKGPNGYEKVSPPNVEVGY